MSLLIAMPHRDPQPLAAALRSVAPDIETCIWPDIADWSTVRMAVLWQHPAGLLADLPGLQVTHSFGAGVEHILNDPALPEYVQIARVSGAKLAASMTGYLLRQVAAASVAGSDNKPAIGLLGYGQLAQAAARAFLQREYPVMAWRRRQPDPATGQPRIFAGPTGLRDMLGQTDVLICLLPLTPDTRDLLNLELFRQCRRGAYLINVGRGAHLVEEDLLTALDEGLLSGACLDVTRNEPLPADHPLTTDPRIILTHHTASLTDPMEAAEVIAENYRRMAAGQPLKFVVDREAGY